MRLRDEANEPANGRRRSSTSFPISPTSWLPLQRSWRRGPKRLLKCNLDGRGMSRARPRAVDMQCNAMHTGIRGTANPISKAVEARAKGSKMPLGLWHRRIISWGPEPGSLGAEQPPSTAANPAANAMPGPSTHAEDAPGQTTSRAPKIRSASAQTPSCPARMYGLCRRRANAQTCFWCNRKGLAAWLHLTCAGALSEPAMRCGASG